MSPIRAFILVLLLFTTISLRSQTSEEFYVNLDEVIVTEKFNPGKFVSQMAKVFAFNRAKDFASELLQYRTVELDGKYCEFNGYKGFYIEKDFNQSEKEEPYDQFKMGSHYYGVPVSVMRSDPFNLGSDLLVSPYLIGITNSMHGTKESTSLEYNNTLSNYSAILIKRTIEVFSPLNNKFTDCYNYSINGFFTNRAEEQLVSISFETKPGVFPSKTRLYGSGTILYNISTKTPEKIYLENFVDFYATAYHWTSYKGHSATRHKFELSYCNMNGIIYPTTVSLDVVWVDSDAPEGMRQYALISNSRLRPFRYHLKEYNRYEFTNPVSINKEQIGMLNGKIANIFSGYYCAPYNPEIWNGISLREVDREKLEKDLNRKGESLTQQAERNALIWYEWYINSNADNPNLQVQNREQRIAFSKEYYKNAPEIHKIIYNILK